MENIINNIQNLLEKVEAIQRKYDDIAEITGENFNIFSVLKMDSKEVRTHSAFIGELLNPKGSHGLKNKPLKLFISLLESKFNEIESKEILINKESKFRLNIEMAIVTVEKYAGIINQDKTEGGRIDIVVEDTKGKALIIENKIYAIEQTNQLIRYSKYNGNAPILYLTLLGNPPNSAGGLEENKEYFNISYKEDIKDWLELCIKEAVDKPMLREVIKQYIYLIKKLTGQSINKVMSEEIVKKMITNIDASLEIANNIKELKLKICQNFIEEIQKRIGDHYTSKKYNDLKMGTKNSGVWFYNKNSEIGLLLYFEEEYTNLMLGIDFIESGNTENRLNKREEFRFIDSIINGDKIKEINTGWINANYVTEEFNLKSWADILDRNNVNSISNKIIQILNHGDYKKYTE